MVLSYPEPKSLAEILSDLMLRVEKLENSLDKKSSKK